ncbi:MAG: endo alpha-1,4 polygalactosaminidase [Anaerolineales bacterium]|nr:endo alpha-1,4 polygalactosaminidase [Anaerolineales bacterium]
MNEFRRKKFYTAAILFIPVLLLACQLFSNAPFGPIIPSQSSTAAGIQKTLPLSITQSTTKTTLPFVAKTGIPIVVPPPSGKLYHGVYPGGITGEEDDLTPNDLQIYEQAAGKTAAWVFFSHNWYHGRQFPLITASWIRQAGSIPYIRLMLRSEAGGEGGDPVYTLQAIIDGNFDADLHTWAQAGRDFSTPLIVEYGIEMNGEWFPWNGKWNGGGEKNGYGDPTLADGPERFRDAYRRIIQICRDENADNILWVFHVNNNDYPEDEWNKFENYYPGSEWIDWLAVSVYGAQTPQETEWQEFRPMLDEVYPRLAALDGDKPIILAEFGVADHNPLGNQAEWAQAALSDIMSMRWSRLIGFSWWNEWWQNDEDPTHDTTMRLQDNPELAQVFQEQVGTNANVLGRVSINMSGQVSTTEPRKVYLPEVTRQITPTIWHPSLVTSWQWQLDDLPIDTSYDVQMYDIDLFDNDAATVAALHAQGFKVVCYVSVGSWEDWRPDADQFPPEVIGNEYDGWPGEKWLDIRRIDLLAPILKARFDQCAAKGFDGLEPDNIDSYTSDTGFPLTAQDQLIFNVWLANEAHARGLSIGLKNDDEQVADLLSYFDWALTEDCVADDWCEQLTPFIEAGKPIFAAEYTDNFQSVEEFCPQLNALNFNGIFKNRDLDAWMQPCR